MKFKDFYSSLENKGNEIHEAQIPYEDFVKPSMTKGVVSIAQHHATPMAFADAVMDADITDKEAQKIATQLHLDGVKTVEDLLRAYEKRFYEE